MSINQYNLEKLKTLRNQLDESGLADRKTSKKNHQKKTYQHPIEFENDPKKLFRELIKASSDGNIPPHLLARLKELEKKENDNDQQPTINDPSLPLSPSSNPPSNLQKQQTALTKSPQIRAGSKEEGLYITFGQLLLEEES